MVILLEQRKLSANALVLCSVVPLQEGPWILFFRSRAMTVIFRALCATVQAHSQRLQHDLAVAKSGSSSSAGFALIGVGSDVTICSRKKNQSPGGVCVIATVFSKRRCETLVRTP